MNRNLGARRLVATSHPFRLAVVLFLLSLVAPWTRDSRAQVPDPPPPPPPPPPTPPFWGQGRVMV